jgi:hypothetical protein
MINTGIYDAYDKWDILCRYWEKPGAVTDPIVDKWNAPTLPHWQELASAGGTYACVEYIDAKLVSLWRELGVGAHVPPVDGALHREIAQLAERLGDDGLRGLVRTLGPTIARAGFLAPFDDRLSPQLSDRLRAVFKTGAIRLLRWSDMRGEVPSVEVLRTRKNSFPVDAIKHKRKALSLFCSLNYGRSDVIHIHDICPDHVTLVDIRGDSLNDMQLIYPSDWTFVCFDFMHFLNQVAGWQQSYDLIVADTPEDFAMELAWDLLPTMMRLCSDTFITHYFTEMFDQLGVAPDDLEGLSRAVKARTGVDVAFTEMMERNSTVYWAVMRRTLAGFTL